MPAILSHTSMPSWSRSSSQRTSSSAPLICSQVSNLSLSHKTLSARTNQSWSFPELRTAPSVKDQSSFIHLVSWSSTANRSSPTSSRARFSLPVSIIREVQDSFPMKIWMFTKAAIEHALSSAWCFPAWPWINETNFLSKSDIVSLFEIVWLGAWTQVPLPWGRELMNIFSSARTTSMLCSEYISGAAKLVFRGYSSVAG